MKIISKRIHTDGRLLVVYETPNLNYVGEVYNKGKRVAGKWDSRATFYHKDKDASEYRVMEYFGFTYQNSKEI